MALDLVDYEQKARKTIKAFWGNREAAKQKQIESGKADQGERAGVTTGKNMDGFLALVLDIITSKKRGHKKRGQVLSFAAIFTNFFPCPDPYESSLPARCITSPPVAMGGKRFSWMMRIDACFSM